MDYPCVPQPPHLKKGLFYHQLVSVYNMEELERTRAVCIDDSHYLKTSVGLLADLAGYGKTLSVLGLISRTDPATPYACEYRKVTSGTDLVRRVRMVPVAKVPATLVVAGPSLTAQWEAELRETTLRFSVIKSKRDAETVNPAEDLDVVLCPSNLLPALLPALPDVHFRRIVLDEPATLRITGLGTLTASFLWLVTATPFDLLGKDRMKYLSDILPDDCDIMARITVRNPDDFVKGSFAMPPTNHHYLQTSEVVPKVLKGIVSDQQYAALLSGHTGRFLTLCGLRPEPGQHYLSALMAHLHRTDETKERALVQRLQQAGRLACVLCGGVCASPHLADCCGAMACQNCLTTWSSLVQSCTVCKGRLTHSEAPIACSDEIAPLRQVPRFTILEKILRSLAPDAKVLIYTHYERVGVQLQTFLGTEYRWSDLRGTRDHKSKVLEDYRTGDLPILLLTGLVDSAGFNLQTTTDIILFDSLTEYVETQVVGRALRIGRSKDLQVHHIV